MNQPGAIDAQEFAQGAGHPVEEEGDTMFERQRRLEQYLQKNCRKDRYGERTDRDMFPVFFKEVDDCEIDLDRHQVAHEHAL